MATLGARAAVRDPVRDVDAILALVSTSRIRSAIATHADALGRLVLSRQERDLFTKAVTMKRKAELLAGRLAAKIVCMAVRGGGNLPPLDSIDVRRDPGGAPLCVWPDGTTQHVSIAHGGAYAMALSAIDDAPCGIDVEPVTRRLDVGIDGLFHPIERLQISRDSDARLCWTVREAWGKLTGRGVAADFDRVATVRAAGAWWLALRKPIPCSALVGAGENASVTIAVAVRRDGSQ